MALCPTCHTEIGRWADDPILTLNGLSGEEYKGFTEPKGKHIVELQDRCKVYEIDYNVLPRTTFSEIKVNSKKICYQHINQLRESTQKILQAIMVEAGYTEEAIFEELFYRFFNFDAEGNFVGNNKANWSETITHKTRIKAIHIEELRHPFFDYIEPVTDPEEPPEEPETCYYMFIYATIMAIGRSDEEGYEACIDEAIEEEDYAVCNLQYPHDSLTVRLSLFRRDTDCPPGVAAGSCLGTGITVDWSRVFPFVGMAGYDFSIWNKSNNPDEWTSEDMIDYYWYAGVEAIRCEWRPPCFASRDNVYYWHYIYGSCWV